jgi:hypothetical protein
MNKNESFSKRLKEVDPGETNNLGFNARGQRILPTVVSAKEWRDEIRALAALRLPLCAAMEVPIFPATSIVPGGCAAASKRHPHPGPSST